MEPPLRICKLLRHSREHQSAPSKRSKAQIRVLSPLPSDPMPPIDAESIVKPNFKMQCFRRTVRNPLAIHSLREMEQVLYLITYLSGHLIRTFRTQLEAISNLIAIRVY